MTGVRGGAAAGDHGLAGRLVLAERRDLTCSGHGPSGNEEAGNLPGDSFRGPHPECQKGNASGVQPRTCISAPRRTRTYNPLIKSQATSERKADAGHDVTPNGPDHFAQSFARGSLGDPDLELILERWSTLPESVRSGIVAIVRGASANNFG